MVMGMRMGTGMPLNMRTCMPKIATDKWMWIVASVDSRHYQLGARVHRHVCLHVPCMCVDADVRMSLCMSHVLAYSRPHLPCCLDGPSERCKLDCVALCMSMCADMCVDMCVDM